MKTFYTDVVNSVICFAKEARASISWLLNEYNLSCKIVKNRILSEVCKFTIKTPPHSTVYLRCGV